MYRNPDSIAECNRGRISSPGLDFVPPTGRESQAVGRKGSFPLDCSEIAVRVALGLRFWPGCPGVGRGGGQLLDSYGMCSRQQAGRGRVSRRGREGAPSDDVLLAGLDLLVESEGIVEAGERLGVNYRTAAKCLEERHVSRRMRQALEKYLREQTEQEEQEDQATAPVPDEPGGGEEARPTGTWGGLAAGCGRVAGRTGVAPRASGGG